MLLVRNGVVHDARVLRAAGVAEKRGPVLVIGAASDSAPAGEFELSGARVVRLSALPRSLSTIRGAVEGWRRSPAGGVVATGAPKPSPAAIEEPPGSSLSPRGRVRRIVVGFVWTVRAARLTITARPELVHANDWNTMSAGVLAKLVCRCALVYDSHELWAERNGRWEWQPWLIACEWLFVRFADTVITTSPGHARALAERYRIPMPTVVRNLPEQIAPPRDRDAPTERTLAYVGGLMPGRGLEQAIDALALLHSVRLRAIGPGARGYRQGLIDRAARLGVADRLELCDPVLPAELVGELAGADVGLCLIQPVCRSYALALPNKLFEYVAAGLPVLCSDLPVMAGVVRGAGLGEVVPHQDPAAIAVGALKLLDGGPDIAADVARFACANRWRDEAPILERLYGALAVVPSNVRQS